ncbi:MAG: ABC transporter ATP-binding protein [Pirellulales bacterium]
MTAIAITAEHLGKSYLIDHEVNRERYTALRDVLASQLKTARQRLRRAFRRRPPAANGRAEEFWALRDVSFEVREGEVLGIIGRNGAGKSTLLKVLSRITEPTAGRATLRGRVASLLEVGTGFHPELTGRENIFLNGAILGMTRAEIKRSFDEIVAFAEVAKFLDTPVKRYSSGMYLRLAFAVAAHLQPEILIIDEVLAVGDAEFQKKCLGKMREVSSSGRTVLFVSHNMAAVQSLCSQSMWIHQGRLEFSGCSETAIAKYLDSGNGLTGGSRHKLSDLLAITRIDIAPSPVRSGDPANITFELEAFGNECVSDAAILIYSPQGQRLAVVDMRSHDGPYRMTSGTKLVLRNHIAAVPFIEGDYSLGIYVKSLSAHRNFMEIAKLSVTPATTANGVAAYEPQHRGYVNLPARLEHELVG